MTPAIQHKYSLKNLNTFSLPAIADYFTAVHREDELLALIQNQQYRQKISLILGGGSNVLLPPHIPGLVIHNRLSGIEVLAETSSTVDIAFAAGENWHDCVSYCVAQGYYGIENLALIPGNIGAAPIQNIGAYGVELKDYFLFCDAIEKSNGNKQQFSSEACQFGYRDSIFKQALKNQYIITRVALRLKKSPKVNLDYPSLARALKAKNIHAPTPQDIYETVIAIRTSKLPDPNKLPNAGSFFKNPVISSKKLNDLRIKHPDIPCFIQSDGSAKLPAAWLIEQCQFKGYRAGNVGVHNKQALVLVNYGADSRAEILSLAEKITTTIKTRFNIDLEREVQAMQVNT